MTDLPFTDFSSAVAAGFGIATTSALVVFAGPALSVASEPHVDIFVPSCSRYPIPILLVGAYASLCMQIVHYAATLLVFKAFRSSNPKHLGTSLALHLGLSFSTMLNSQTNCLLGTSVTTAVTATSAFVAFLAMRTATT